MRVLLVDILLRGGGMAGGMKGGVCSGDLSGLRVGEHDVTDMWR